nr:MAG: bacteriocin-processing peptidase family protein [Hyphomicrobiales bacterium]
MRCPWSVSLSGLALAGLLGCAAPHTEQILQFDIARPRVVELDDIPFFPQEKYYCGPASLATVLAWNKMQITPDDLVAEVYTPSREGTFATDIIAAARRHGLLAVEINDLRSLLDELEQGRPVLVMQNLALSWFPQWHFAVAIGYDLAGPQIILRSGTTRRLLTPLDAFERTWERADSWAIVVLPPDGIPANADETSWLTAISGLERAGHAQEAVTAYRIFLERFSGHRIALIGEANALFALEDYSAAEQGYRQLLARDPNMAEAWNNLAYALYFQGRHADAVNAAQRAVSIAGGGDENYLETLRELSALSH